MTKTWINLWSTGTPVSAYSVEDRNRGHVVEGEVRTYGNGRQRAVTSLGERTTFSFALRLVSSATIDTLRTWQGQTVQVRDHRGQKFVGTYFGLAVSEHKSELNAYDVAITLSGVTVAEGV